MNFTKIMAMVEANIWLASTLSSPRQLPEMEPGRKDELSICWEFSLKPPILERIRRKRWTGSPALNCPFQISAEIKYILHSTTLIRGQNSKAPHGIQSDLSKMQSRSRHSPILNPSVVHLILWRGSKLVSASHKLPRLELLCPPQSFIPFHLDLRICITHFYYIKQMAGLQIRILCVFRWATLFAQIIFCLPFAWQTPKCLLIQLNNLPKTFCHPPGYLITGPCVYMVSWEPSASAHIQHHNCGSAWTSCWLKHKILELKNGAFHFFVIRA